MNNVDSLTINKNDSEHYNYPKNLQSNETKQTNFFSPIINSSHIPDNISINENTRKKDFIKINSQTVNKKTLVLDLDETLVHSSMTPFPNGSDLTIEINVAGNKYNVYVDKDRTKLGISVERPDYSRDTVINKDNYGTFKKYKYTFEKEEDTNNFIFKQVEKVEE